MRDLKEIRKSIDEIDSQIIELFKKRMDCAKESQTYEVDTSNVNINYI